MGGGPSIDEISRFEINMRRILQALLMNGVSSLSHCAVSKRRVSVSSWCTALILLSLHVGIQKSSLRHMGHVLWSSSQARRQEEPNQWPHDSILHASWPCSRDLGSGLGGISLSRRHMEHSLCSSGLKPRMEAVWRSG